MPGDRYDRQILAFGKEGQEKIQELRIAIVGLGGIGSHICQGLAYVGVRDFLIIDDDKVEFTNLNRLVSTTPEDAEKGRFKADIIKGMIMAINPDAKVISLKKNLRSDEALDALISYPVLFSCVDHDAPRLIAMELASAYELTMIDSATEIIPENKKLAEFGGRVIICRPGEYCLDCAGQIDLDVAKQELESIETQEIIKNHGYGLGSQFKAPSVISLNGIIANLAITEFIMMVTGIREPNHHITYYGMKGNVNIRQDKRKNGCYTCEYLKGKKDKANIKRYVNNV